MIFQLLRCALFTSNLNYFTSLFLIPLNFQKACVNFKKVATITYYSNFS